MARWHWIAYISYENGFEEFQSGYFAGPDNEDDAEELAHEKVKASILFPKNKWKAEVALEQIDADLCLASCHGGSQGAQRQIAGLVLYRGAIGAHCK